MIRRHPIMSPSFRASTLLLAACVAAGCTGSTPPSPKSDAATTDCAEPRPKICTREYFPVCGLRDSGIECVTTPCDTTEWKTYANACTACSDPDVDRYRPGACPEDEEDETP